MPALLTSKTHDRSTLMNRLDPTRIPRHISVIMDGNGRWAKARHLPRVFGHRAGITAVREAVRACGEFGVGYLTLYAFSAENWARPNTEVKALMKLLEHYLVKELPELHKNKVRLKAIGRLDSLPANAKKRLSEAISATADNTGLTLTLALNYGGRQEIIDAVNKAMKAGRKSITEKELSEYLYAGEIPDPDLLIRTSGEMRLSNFLLWQTAYTELYITKTLWPDFRRDDLILAIDDYQHRDRRFGGL